MLKKSPQPKQSNLKNKLQATKQLFFKEYIKYYSKANLRSTKTILSYKQEKNYGKNSKD